MQKELQAEGEDPLVLFMQLEAFDATPEFIEMMMEGSSVPVLQDTAALDLWGKYHSFWPEFKSWWYHIVIIDASGCLAAHFGPVLDEDLEGPGSAALKAAWVEALHAECSAYVVEREDGAERVEVIEEPDIIEGDGFAEIPDLVEDPGSDLVDLAELDELPADAPEVDLADVPDEADFLDLAFDEYTEPFQLQDICQVEEAEALQPGQHVPHFLCKDMNPASEGFGNPVSDLTLKGVVWLAYYGSCT